MAQNGNEALKKENNHHHHQQQALQGDSMNGRWKLADITYSEEESDLEELFEQWMTKHGKIYKSEHEKELRFNLFKQCVKRVNEHNKTKGITWIMGLNQFSDYTTEEFASGFRGFRT